MADMDGMTSLGPTGITWRLFAPYLSMLPEHIGLQRIGANPFFFVWATEIIYSSLNRLFAICAAMMGVLTCIVLTLYGYLRPGGVSGTW